MNPNALAIATYCLAVPAKVPVENLRPLKSLELAALTSWLGPRNLTVADILDMSVEDRLETLAESPIPAERISHLMDRAGQVAIEMQHWSDYGIWVLTREAPEYPDRWLTLLGDSAPALLFGVGPSHLLKADSVAIVGSRNADEATLAFAEQAAARLQKGGSSIVSGAARGVDRQAMQAAIAAGGYAIGVMSDGMARAIREQETRSMLEDEQLVLVSPYRPDAGFNVGTAMGRNKLIYCQSYAAIVVATDNGKGGTWAGAVENLKHGWVPLYVRNDDGAPAGNTALLDVSISGRRAIPLTEVPEDGVLPPPLGFETPTDMVQLALT